MKILQVISSFYPAFSYGGPAKVAFGLSKKLADNGHEITVYTTDVYNAHSRLRNYTNPEIIEGIEVFRFANISNWLAHKNISFAPGMALALRENIDDFDIVHLHEYRSPQAAFVHRYAACNNVPYVLQAHGSVHRLMGKRGMKQLYDSLCGYRLLRDAKKIISLSRFETGQYINMGVRSEEIKVVPNGIDITALKKGSAKGVFRKKIGIGYESRIILFAGRVHRIKGIDFLIRSFKALSDELDDALLVIVGPDEGCKDELEHLASLLGVRSKVFFTGFMDDVSQAYVDADVLVYPSIYEIFGLVPLEAIACGTPVIVTNNCGCGEIITDVQCGRIVRYGDIEGLKEALKLSLQETDVNAEMIRRGQKFIKECLCWESIASKMERIYEDCIYND